MANPKVRKRLDKIAVGLAAHCDPPKVEEKLLVDFTKRFKGAPSLPFVAFVTHDYKWVHGFHGGRTLSQFLEDLDVVEKSPLLPATKAVEKAVGELAAAATTAADGEDWAAVLAAMRKAAKLSGHCDGRDELEELRAQAADVATMRFDDVMATLLGADDAESAAALDIRALKAELKAVAKLWKGEPEADSARVGQKAIDRYCVMIGLSGTARETARTRNEKEFGESPWAVLFEADE